MANARRIGRRHRRPRASRLRGGAGRVMDDRRGTRELAGAGARVFGSGPDLIPTGRGGGAHRVAGPHPRGPRRRLHRGRQAGPVREAPRRRHRGCETGPRRRGRGRAEARPGGAHACLRSAAHRPQAGDRRGRDRPADPLSRHPRPLAGGRGADRGQRHRQLRGPRHPFRTLAHGGRRRVRLHEPRRGRAGATGQHPARPPPAHLPGRRARLDRGEPRLQLRLRGRRRVSGERGTLRTPSVTSPILRKDGGASRAIETDWLERFETAYRIEAEAWVRAARAGGATGPTAWDGYCAMRVAEAAERSLATGRAEAVPDEPRPALYDAP